MGEDSLMGDDFLMASSSSTIEGESSSVISPVACEGVNSWITTRERVPAYHGVDERADEGNTDGKSQIRSPNGELLLRTRALPLLGGIPP